MAVAPLALASARWRPTDGAATAAELVVVAAVAAMVVVAAVLAVVTVVVVAAGMGVVWVGGLAAGRAAAAAWTMAGSASMARVTLSRRAPPPPMWLPVGRHRRLPVPRRQAEAAEAGHWLHCRGVTCAYGGGLRS